MINIACIARNCELANFPDRNCDPKTCGVKKNEFGESGKNTIFRQYWRERNKSQER